MFVYDSCILALNGVVVVLDVAFSSSCGYWIKSSMTVKDAGNDGRPALPLWIADQVRNDVVVVSGSYSAWRFPRCGFPPTRE